VRGARASEEAAEPWDSFLRLQELQERQAVPQDDQSSTCSLRPEPADYGLGGGWPSLKVSPPVAGWSKRRALRGPSNWSPDPLADQWRGHKCSLVGGLERPTRFKSPLKPLRKSSPGVASIYIISPRAISAIFSPISKVKWDRDVSLGQFIIASRMFRTRVRCSHYHAGVRATRLEIFPRLELRTSGRFLANLSCERSSGSRSRGSGSRPVGIIIRIF
jgi:hypothetical protein